MVVFQRLWGNLKVLFMNTSYGLKNSDCVHFSDKTKFNLFRCDGRMFVRRRNDIRLSALKAVLNLEKEVWWYLAWFLLLVPDPWRGYTVRLTQLYTKRYWRNMYLIWELQLINQQYLCKITLHVTQRSLSRHFFLRRMLLLWSGLLKAPTWILLRVFGSYEVKELWKRIQETSKNYRLIWKENGRKYPLMNARH